MQEAAAPAAKEGAPAAKAAAAAADSSDEESSEEESSDDEDVKPAAEKAATAKPAAAKAAPMEVDSDQDESSEEDSDDEPAPAQVHCFWLCLRNTLRMLQHSDPQLSADDLVEVGGRSSEWGIMPTGRTTVCRRVRFKAGVPNSIHVFFLQAAKKRAAATAEESSEEESDGDDEDEEEEKPAPKADKKRKADEVQFCPFSFPVYPFPAPKLVRNAPYAAVAEVCLAKLALMTHPTRERFLALCI